MTIKDLINMCDNIKPETKIMMYESLHDYTENTTLWNEYEASQLTCCTHKIVKFEVYNGFVAVALES